MAKQKNAYLTELLIPAVAMPVLAALAQATVRTTIGDRLKQQRETANEHIIFPCQTRSHRLTGACSLSLVGKFQEYLEAWKLADWQASPPKVQISIVESTTTDLIARLDAALTEALARHAYGQCPHKFEALVAALSPSAREALFNGQLKSHTLLSQISGLPRHRFRTRTDPRLSPDVWANIIANHG